MSNYLHIPDVSGEDARIADAAVLDITGDLEFQFRGVKQTWDIASSDYLLSKWTGALSNRSYRAWLRSGAISFGFCDTADRSVVSTAKVPFTDGEDGWMKVTVDVDNGAGDSDFTFYTSSDGVSWTQLGDVVNFGSVIALQSGASALSIAGNASTSPWIGGVQHFRLYDGIGGTLVVDADFTNLTPAELAAGEFTEDSTNAATVTLYGDELAYVRPVTSGILSRAELLLQADDGNEGASPKWADRSGNDHHAQLGSAAGADTNDPEWLPWTSQNYVHFNSAAGNSLTVTLAAATIYDYTVTYLGGTTDTGTVTTDGAGLATFDATDAEFDGLDVVSVDVYPDGGGTTVALFDASLALEPFATVTDSLAKVWTINRSGSGLYVVDQAAFGFHTDDSMVVADHADLDFNEDEDLTFLVVGRIADTTPPATQYWASKLASATGYSLYHQTGGTVQAYIGGTAIADGISGTASLTQVVLAARRKTAVSEWEGFIDGVGTGSPATDTTTDVRGTGNLVIGANVTALNNFFDGEVMAVALFREALTDDEIAEVGNYLTDPDYTPPPTTPPTTSSGRAKLSPVIDACIAIAESTGIVVGDGVAPDCPKPYIIVSAVSSPRYTGPLSNTEADSRDRIQFSFVGDTREQADWARDKLRAALTTPSLDAEFVTASANRRTLRVILDIPRGVQRDDRGLPDPIFMGIDQYMIETTPTI